MKKTILLTGSSGFLGHTFLVDALKKKYHVIDILRFKNKKNKKLNDLRKKFPNSYKSIFYQKNHEIIKKIRNLKVDYFLNFATLYKASHKNSEIYDFIDSNILFPTIILNQIYKKIEKIINFGSMMQHLDGLSYKPKNFYAATKSAFEMIINFYSLENKKLKFYNIKLYESFAKFDKRKKLIPTLLKNYKNNQTTKINSKKLELNIVHVDDIINFVNTLLNENEISGSYCLKQFKNVKISNLIHNINKQLVKNNKKKLSVEFQNKKIDKIKLSKIKISDKWKPAKHIEKKIIKEFIK